MKKQSPDVNEEFPKSYQGKGYILTFGKDFWLAHDPDDHLSGLLLYDRKHGTFSTVISPLILDFPQLAKGAFKSPEDCPVHENHTPKGGFLMLLALRARFKEPVKGSDFVNKSWREQAFRTRFHEVELLTGKPVSDSNQAHCIRIAQSKLDFNEYVGSWLTSLIRDDNASENLIRLGKWIKSAEEIESEKIPDHYSRFCAAVEKATPDAKLVVPYKKDVQKIYEKGVSVNQLGKGQGFRDIMRQLHFDWLPAGGRGPAKNPRISGIKSKT